jgi:hypothetical protein
VRGGWRNETNQTREIEEMKMNWKDLFPKENRYFETEDGTLYNNDVLEVLKQLPDESIDCVITSPPYWALRDYGVEGQLGLEPTFQEYLWNQQAGFIACLR